LHFFNSLHTHKTGKDWNREHTLDPIDKNLYYGFDSNKCNGFEVVQVFKDSHSHVND